MGERFAAGRLPEPEWRPVLLPAYAAARRRHAVEREEAYESAREEQMQVCGPDLRIADIDARALEVWHATWRGVHPYPAGNWNWPGLVERLPRRAAVLPIAIWYGDDLCGMALGYASRRRSNGSRHTITLTHVERRPEPPAVPLKGYTVAIAVNVALKYGLSMGARRLRLRNPDRKLLGYYQGLGFAVVWKGEIPVYCEQEV
jgi:hypothetical protein